MDKQKPTGESTAYTGRFGDRTAAKSEPAVSPRRNTRAAGAQRRPTGFSAAPQSAHSKKAPEAPAPEKKAGAKKEKKAKQPRPPREKKNRSGMKALLIVLGVLLALLLLIVLIFGGEDQTYHQMPVIERENIASFEPVVTPLPGTEVS